MATRMATALARWALAVALVLSAAGAHAQAVFIPLGDLPGNGFRSDVFAISGDGTTVVGKSNSTVFLPSEGRNISGAEAYRWTEAGGIVGLGQLVSPSMAFTLISQALGVNQDGSVVVGNSLSDQAATLEGFRWTEAGGLEALGFLFGTQDSQAADVSDDGSVVVGKSDPDGSGGSPGEAFRWTSAGGMVGLGDLPGGIFNSRAVASTLR